jgi:hypothetical protein
MRKGDSCNGKRVTVFEACARYQPDGLGKKKGVLKHTRSDGDLGDVARRVPCMRGKRNELEILSYGFDN